MENSIIEEAIWWAIIASYWVIDRVYFWYEVDYDDNGDVVENEDADIVYSWEQSNILENCIHSISWHKTDAWRWYYWPLVAPWRVEARDDWIPTIFDETTVDKINEYELMEKIASWELFVDFDMVILYLNTSNIFSMWISVLVKEEDKEKLIALYKANNVNI